MFKTIGSWFMTTISIITAFGVFMHDGHLDKVVLSEVGTPIDGAHVARSGHTHSDYNAANSLLNHSFAYQSPSVPPRSAGDRRRRLALPTELARHAFDDILMPILT